MAKKVRERKTKLDDFIEKKERKKTWAEQMLQLLKDKEKKDKEPKV